MIRPVLLAFALAATGCSEEAPPLRLTTTIPLEGVEGRIDHMAIDVEAKRLYVAALGNGSVETVDLAAGKRLEPITGLHEPQDVALIPGDGTLAVSCGGDGEVRFYDRERKLLSTLDHLDDADNMRYDAEAKLLYVGYGSGGLAVIDPAKRSLVASIKLAGHPESFQLEQKGPRIFVNIPGARQVAVVDRVKRAVVATWAVQEARSNFPMALDEAAHRLFVGCRNPAKLLSLDTADGSLKASVDCAGDADDIFCVASRIMVSGGDGTITLVGRGEGERLAVEAKVSSADGARTSLLGPSGDRLYVAAPRRAGKSAGILVYEVLPPAEKK